MLQTDKGDHTVATNHLTIPFPLKSPENAQAVTEELPPMMPEFSKALDDIGTVHYSRFTLLNGKTLIYLADFDGEFAELMRALAGSGGAVFDTIFKHVANAPPTPVGDNAEAFVEWTADQLLHPLIIYSAYPGVTVKEIK